ncbi:MAG: hypothetical protein H6606_05385 [Flavobacteriales bacterium]|nr:hypothetical protein [Flavobacteriales bacterium]
MRRGQWIKILVLLLFVGLLAVSSVYLYRNFVLKSPYYQQDTDAGQD